MLTVSGLSAGVGDGQRGVRAGAGDEAAVRGSEDAGGGDGGELPDPLRRLLAEQSDPHEVLPDLQVSALADPLPLRHPRQLHLHRRQPRHRRRFARHALPPNAAPLPPWRSLDAVCGRGADVSLARGRPGGKLLVRLPESVRLLLRRRAPLRGACLALHVTRSCAPRLTSDALVAARSASRSSPLGSPATLPHGGKPPPDRLISESWRDDLGGSRCADISRHGSARLKNSDVHKFDFAVVCVTIFEYVAATFGIRGLTLRPFRYRPSSFLTLNSIPSSVSPRSQTLHLKAKSAKRKNRKKTTGSGCVRCL
eukprot:3513783-Rhodomonas_salina.5